MKITNTTILKKGDILKEGDYHIKVIETLGDLYFISWRWIDIYSKEDIASRKSTSADAVTLEYFINNNFELVTPEWSADDLKDGDMYWAISSTGDAGHSTWHNNSTDNFRKKTNNIFPTKELAEARYKEIMK